MINRVFNSFSSPAQWVINWVKGWDWGDGREEKRLTTMQSLTYAPIWHGVNKISGHVGQLPVQVFKRLERGAERDRTHQIARVMRRPNPNQIGIVFREQIAAHSLMDGNGRAAIVRKGGTVVELIPLLPECTVTAIIGGIKVHGTRPSEDDRLRMFFPNIPGDNAADGLIMLDDVDVIHIPGLSLNGFSGVALRDIAARNIGASINAEKRLASQMENGYSGNIMLEAPVGVFRKQAEAEEFIEAFEKRHHGVKKGGKPGILREGIKANVLSMNNRDAEMIDNRKFQRQDAALYLGLESILGDDASVSYNSLEQKNQAYLTNCLNRWLIRWEQELEYKLLPKKQYDNDTHFVKINTAALLKSDFPATVTALSTLVNSTIFSRNDARDKLDMNPVEGGDVYENPAITPGKTEPAAPQHSKEQQPTKNKPVIREIMAQQSRIAHLISTEALRIREASKQAKEKGLNFIEWMDRFYDRNWEPNLADILEEMEIDRDEARLHCDESRRQLLAVCDVSQPENLVENVEKCVSTWKSRAFKIGNKDV